jgi:hypothetical protein
MSGRVGGKHPALTVFRQQYHRAHHPKLPKAGLGEQLLGVHLLAYAVKM